MNVHKGGGKRRYDEIMGKRSVNKGVQGKAIRSADCSAHPFVGADGSGPLAEAAARLLVAAAEAEDELVVTGPAQVCVWGGGGQYMMSRFARLLGVGVAGGVRGRVERGHQGRGGEGNLLLRRTDVPAVLGLVHVREPAVDGGRGEAEVFAHGDIWGIQVEACWGCASGRGRLVGTEL